MIHDFISPLDEAKYLTVHEYPGGVKALATLVRVAPGTLNNKVNPSVETHHLTVDEAVVIQAVTRDYRMLDAQAHALGHGCYALGDYSRCSDSELLDLYLEMIKQAGETARTIQQSLEDGVITQQEFNDIDREMSKDIRTILELRARLHGLRTAE